MGKDSSGAQAGSDAARYAANAQAASAREALDFARMVYGNDTAWREKTYADQLQMLVEQQRRARQQYAQQIQYRHPFVYAGQSAATGLMQLLGLQMPAMPGVIQESQFGKGAVSGFPFTRSTGTSSTGGGGGGGGGTGGGGGGGGSTPLDCSKATSGAVARAACCAAQPDSVGCKGAPGGGEPGGGNTTVDCTKSGDAFHQAACCAAQPDSVGCKGEGGGGGGEVDPCAGLGAMGHAACCAVNKTAPSCASGSYSSYTAGGRPTDTFTGMSTQTMTDPNGNTKQVPASLVSFYQQQGWS